MLCCMILNPTLGKQTGRFSEASWPTYLNTHIHTHTKKDRDTERDGDTEGDRDTEMEM